MKLLVTFSRKEGKKPIIAQVVRDTGVLVNVERAIIDSSEGEALIDIPDESCRAAGTEVREVDPAREDFEHQSGTHKIPMTFVVDPKEGLRILEEEISLDENECVDCGACISICPQEVFSFDEEFRLRVDAKRCVLCGRCIEICPHRALSRRVES